MRPIFPSSRRFRAACRALAVAPAAAQEPYPTRPIHIIVPFPAGGPSDVLTRMIGERMSADFGQAIVVDNRPGANTVIGAQLAAKAAPDGYTLLMAINSTLVMNQYLYAQPALRSAQRFRAGLDRGGERGAARGQCRKRSENGKGFDRESQGSARQIELRRRNDHHQAHLHFVQREGRRRNRADLL